MAKRRRRKYTLATCIALVLILGSVAYYWHFNEAEAAVIVWDGGGATNNWSEDQNWAGDVEPGTSDVATFDGTSTKDVTIDAAISVQGIDINSGYTGTITQAAGITVTVGTGDFDISDGTFTGGDSTIDINDAFTVSGGSFTSTTGELQIAGAFTVSSGTFEPSTGTVVADTTGSTWNVNVDETFNNLEVDRTSTFVITSGDTLIVNGTFTHTNGVVNTGTIDLRGDAVQAATADGGTATIDFGDDTVVQTYTINGGTSPVIELDDPDDANDDIDLSADAVLSLTGTAAFSGAIPLNNPGDFTPTLAAWTQAAGTYDASAQTAWNVSGSITISGGTFTAPNLVTFTASGGSLDVNTTQTFENVTVNRASATTLGANDTVVITGLLTLTNGAINQASGTWDVRGDVSQGSGFDGGSSYVSFGDDAVVQTYSIAGGTSPGILLNDPDDANDDIDLNATATITDLNITAAFSGAIPFNNPSDFTPTFADWTQAAGTYDASAQTAWNIANDFTISGGTFTAPDLLTFSSSAGGLDVNTTQTFENVTVNRSSATTLGANDTVVITGLLTLTNGAINQASGTWDVRGNVSQGSGFDGGSSYVSFGDDAVAQTYTLAGGSAPGIRFNDPDDANDDVDITAAPTSISDINVTAGFSGAIPFNNPSDFTITVTDWTQAAGTYDASAQTAWNIASDFVISGGTFTSPGLVTFSSVTGSLDVNTTQTFESVTINRSSATNLGANDTVVVTGALTLTNGGVNQASSTISAQGDVTVGSGFDGGTTMYSFTGGATQAFDLTGATGLINSDISVNKSGGQVNLASALVMDAANQDLTIVEGTLDLAGQNLTVNGTSGTFSVQDGGVLELFGSETFTLNASNPTLSSGSTVRYTGDGDAASDTYTVTTLEDVYHHLTINSTDGATDTFQLGAAIDINGNFTNTAGTFDVSASDFAMTVAGNWSNSGTFTAQSGTVTLDGSAQTISGSTTFNNFTKTVAAADSLTFPAGATQTFTGTMTLQGASTTDRLSLESSTPGVKALIDPQGTRTVSYLDVQDNDNNNATAITCGTGCFDSGNNENWLFPGIQVSTISGNTTEAGGTATFTVVLGTQPTDDVTVTLDSDDTTEGTVDQTTLTFTNLNWDTPQTVTVTGVDDDVDDGDIAYSIVLDPATSPDPGYDGFDPSDVSATNTDNDTAGVTITESGGSTDVAEAGATSDTYTIVLDSEPTDDVDITITDDADATTDLASVSFTALNWDTPQTVTVTAVDDATDETNPHTSTITHSAASVGDALYDGIAIANVSANVTDDDDSAITVSVISGNTTEAGATATFTVVLESQPSADVAIDLDSNDTTEGTVDQTTLTFTNLNWDTPQTVTVTGQDDDVDDGNIAYDIVLDPATSADGGFNGVDPSDVDVTNVDNDTAGVTITESAGTTDVEEGGATDTYTIVLTSEPTATVTVDITVDAQETVDDSSLDFTTLNWDTPQTVTVTAVDDASDEADIHTGTITHAATSLDGVYDGITINDVTVNVTDDDSASGGGGGGGTPSRPEPSPTNYSILIEDGARTTPDSVVSVLLSAEHADEYELSNSSSFSGSTWASFDEPEQEVVWTLSVEQGLATVYARFRNSEGAASSTVSDTIEIVPGAVQEPGEEEPGEGEEESEEGASESADGQSAPSDIRRFIRTAEQSTMYAEFQDGTMRIIPDLQTFLSYSNGCHDFEIVDSIETGGLAAPLALNSGVVLAKLTGQPEVYTVEIDANDPRQRILRHLVSESVAAANFGPNWADYVVEIQTFDGFYSIGDPITGMTDPSAQLNLRSRSALNAGVTYGLSIELPNGERRSSLDFARIVNVKDGVVRYSFEDGSDGDYNDVVVEVDTTNCLTFDIKTLPLDASEHHKVWMTVYWDGKPKKEVLLIEDSQMKVNTLSVLEIFNEARIGVTERMEIDGIRGSLFTGMSRVR